jgi:hypothetical protein
MQCDTGYMQTLLRAAQLRPDPHQHEARLSACQRTGAENIHPARRSPSLRVSSWCQQQVTQRMLEGRPVRLV